jgi:hypothetical protein
MSNPNGKQRQPHPEPAYIPTKYLMCRNAHHHQFMAKRVRVVEWEEGDAYQGDWKCRGCGLPKREWIDPNTGERLRTPAYGYSLVPGYLFKTQVDDRKAFNLEIRKETYWRLATGGQAKKRGKS